MLADAAETDWTAFLRNGRFSVAHGLSPVSMPQPSVMLGKAASGRFSSGSARAPNSQESTGAEKKSTAHTSAVSWRRPWRGRCSGCSRGNHASWTAGSSVGWFTGTVSR
ncbi:hypothetical protein ACFQ0O_00085 [Saccharopolyspora spinosporotrichia]